MSPLSKSKIVVVCGPTGAGKTGFAIDLARRFNGEIIGADSMQIYRHMDIGTAKPTPAEQAAVLHHMIDIVDPDEDFDAAAYAAMAGDIVRRVVARGRRAFVVGGTGLYIKALIYGLFEQGPSDAAVRERLRAQAQADGGEAMYRKLARIDPTAAGRIHPNDTYRTLRALEIYKITGKPLSVVQQRHGFREPRFTSLEIGLSWPRPILYDRINRRVDEMMAQGFLDEVGQLLAAGYTRDLKSMQSLGYRHLAAVIEGEAILDDTLRTLKRDHRRYAKRQLTWFGAREGIHWLTPDQSAKAAERIQTFFG
ncbi:tRNA (adenosine(37)-N6)-dimethylallyltransferase MiaA [Desulfosarcina ovata]|uniref:tRNA dimethylallyltransferase n=1 Tax=Desulfosarcina ovata subsp. ovata TaxID=2752305 RepID=A0A5K8AA96_9BACT|nr:tRNA (adenosine(37)-N6)-dimethylallyltransferase MiaA [Desulfosarcina ovata]BBO89419.1 tRNA dimethylallyltransferase [Desulfosarcina ovata subsp. ovata]